MSTITWDMPTLGSVMYPFYRKNPDTNMIVFFIIQETYEIIC